MMSLLSALNPLTYGRKQAAAWNALMGAYTFSRLSEKDQQIVISAADEVSRRVWRRSFDDMARKNSPLVAYNVLVYGMRELGIRPACRDQLWFHVKNPFAASIGAEELLGFTRRQLEKEYGMKIPDLE
jgi:hypothetical protein